MDPAAQQDYQPRANSLYPNHHLQQPQHQQPANHSAYKQQHQQQQQQLPGSRDQVRRQQQLQQDDAFRTFSIASSESASSVRSRQKPPAAGLRSRSPGSAECSSPGSSYDDLFADNPVMPSECPISPPSHPQCLPQGASAFTCITVKIACEGKLQMLLLSMCMCMCPSHVMQARSIRMSRCGTCQAHAACG